MIDPANRFRIENAFENITFTGYVSKCEELTH